MTDKFRPTTRAVRAGIDSETQHGAVVPPIILSTNFTFDGFGGKREYDYSRSGNPTRDLLGDALAALEGGAGGTVTATGMGAITLVLHALLAPGELLLIPHDCYGGSWRLFHALAKKGLFTLETCDFTDLASLAPALARQPKLVWLETPSNPLLRLTDLAAVTSAAHAAGALVAVDNTFLSPSLQRPIEQGADVVIHSTTKYINGHSDIVGGAVIAKDQPVHDEMRWWANCLGITGAPFDSYLTLRGLRTLDARLRVHQENTAAIVELLTGHGAVEAVYYPGIPTHPGHDIAKLQQHGFGAMLSFEVVGGEDGVRALFDGLHCYTLAESLGGVESLIAHPATMTHAAMTDEARAAAGISSSLIRLSVGIEDPADLVADLRAGLERAAAAATRPRAAKAA